MAPIVHTSVADPDAAVAPPRTFMRTRFAPSSAAGVTARLVVAIAAGVWRGAAARPGPARRRRRRRSRRPPRDRRRQGQPPAPGQGQQPPVFRAGANFVRVDVYPTADGKPVMDLKQEDFEVSEDGVPQKVETFEHVVIQAPTALERARAPEPNTVAQSREMVAESKARLFVLFLDTYHISREGAMNSRAALIAIPVRGARPGRPHRGHDAGAAGGHRDVRPPDREHRGDARAVLAVEPPRRAHGVRPDRGTVHALLPDGGRGHRGNVGDRARDDPASPRAHDARVAPGAGGPPRRPSRGAEGGPGRQRGLDPLRPRQPGCPMPTDGRAQPARRRDVALRVRPRGPRRRRTTTSISAGC